MIKSSISPVAGWTTSGVLMFSLEQSEKKGVRVKLGDLHDGLVLPAGALEHLVLPGVRVRTQVAHVGDVHHPVHIIARPAQELLQHILHDIGAQVPDVGKVVHRRAAGVHLHTTRDMGGKGLFLWVAELYNSITENLHCFSFVWAAFGRPLSCSLL